MIDEKFMNEVIETLNMRAVEEVEQYAGQAIDTVDTGVFLALEKWLRLKEDFLSADISPKVIEPISPLGENGRKLECFNVDRYKFRSNRVTYPTNHADIEAMNRPVISNYTQHDPKDAYAAVTQIWLGEREEWEAKRKEGLHVIDILLSHLKQTSHYDGVAISRIYRLRDLLADKDEVPE